MEETGVFYAIFLSETFIAILGVIVFKTGRWKSKQV
jgi:Na+-driven multidrug efflux pump